MNGAPAVFVTGATGTVGSAVVEFLMARDVGVVAGMRGGGGRAGLPEGVERRYFDFGMPERDLHEALQGCDRLFLMRPPAVSDVRTHLFPLIDAAVRCNIRHVVFLSLQGVRFNRRTPHHAVESYLRSAGAPFTFLRPNFFMQNLSTTYAPDIRDRDQIFVPAGRSRTAFIDARDIGRAAAAVLTSPDHVGKAYTLSGEQSLSYRAVAGILSDILHRPIRYPRPSEHDYLARLAAEQRPADYIGVQKMIYRVVRLNVSAFPNRAIRRLTGEPATTFRQFAQRERTAWAPTH